MLTKKNCLSMLLLFVLASSVSYAQIDTAKLWKNNNLVAKKNSQQFNEFATNSNPYPARPRDMWEIGVGIGGVTMSGDLRNDVGLGYTLTARKSLSHVFSIRPYYSYYSVKGDANINVSQGSATQYPELRDYKSRSWHLGADAMVSLNTIRSYKGNPKFNIYLLAGFGVAFNQVQKDYLFNGNFTNWYNYPDFNTLGNIADKNADGRGKKHIVPTFNIGGGIAYKINDRLNLGLEAKNSLTNYDYLDGFSSPFSNAFDAFWFSSLRVNYNIGKKDKRVQPLWWINPNNYVYNELNTPEHLKNKLKVKLDDADGDGIADQFDLEPNTPAGVAVDSHGKAIDSDGDGIPDYKDKELLTQSGCFPVNADGVGVCPPSACCKETQEKIEILQRTIDTLKMGGGRNNIGGDCGLNNLPSIVFGSGSKLNRDNMRLLDAVASQMKNTPECKLKVVGHPEASNKVAQQKAYDRVASIINYLVNKQGISENRFIFAYDGGSGDGNTIDLEGTTEEGPNTVPAPAPHLRGKN
jgi:OmpA-OmpF porin, OOP family